MMLRIFLATSLIGCAGCSDSALSKEDVATFDGADTGMMDTDDVDEDTPPPDAWTARATLAITDGAPSLDGAAVTIDLVATGDETPVDCPVQLDVSGLVASTPPEAADGAVYAWWTLPIVPVDDDTCAVAGLPEIVGIGIGTLHPDQRARLGAYGYDDVADSIFGAYLSTGDEAVYAFGFAGTADDLLGDDAAADPPPDGVYAVQPLFLFALPESD